MPQMYPRDVIEQYMKDEQKQQEEQKKKKKTVEMKLAEELEKTRSAAKTAFEETQKNRFELEALRGELTRTKRIAGIAIAIAIICMALVMGDELASLSALL